MKKLMAILLAGLLSASVGCGGTASPEREPWQDPAKIKPAGTTVALLEDTKFTTGIHMLGQSPENEGRTTFGKLDYMGTALEAENEPLWVSAQWCSSYNLATELKAGRASETKNGDTYTYEDPAKTIAVNPKTGEITLTVRSSVDYGDTPRVPGQGWTHLLLEQNFPHPKPMKELDEVRVSMDYVINSCEMKMTEQQYNPLIHAAQLVWFITCRNMSDTEGSLSDYMWFSVALWDSRGIAKRGTTTIDPGTQHYMSGPDPFLYLGKYRDRSLYDVDQFWIPVGERVSFEIDVLPYMRQAFTDVQNAGGLKGCKLENMAVDYMNMGWEIPGTFDVSATIYSMGIDGVIYEK